MSRWYSQGHYDLIHGRKDSPSDVQERLDNNRIRALVNAEREQLFPVITQANARECILWQEARIREMQGGAHD